MKRINYLFVMLATLSLATACNNVNYKKSKSGMLYKIFPSDSKDSIAKPGDWVKLNFTIKLNDSVLQTTYGKMPFYTKASISPETAYNPTELLVLVKTGDSAVCVALADTLFKRGQLPEGKIYKKGDRLVTSFKVLSVFKNDSTYMADQKVENALATGADYIISTDLSCLMHVDGYIKKHNASIKVKHIADVLTSGW